MDENGNGGVLGCAKCDSCNVKRTGTMHHHMGTPVLFTCGVCDPRSYWRALRDAVRAVLFGNPHKNTMYGWG